MQVKVMKVKNEGNDIKDDIKSDIKDDIFVKQLLKPLALSFLRSIK